MAIKSDAAQGKLDIQTPEQSREELQAELLAVLIDEERKEADIKGLKHTLSGKKAELEGLVLKRRETMMKLEGGQVTFNVSVEAEDDDAYADELNADYPSDEELAEYDECDTPEPDSETKMLPGAVVEAEEDEIEIEIEEDEETEDAA